MTMLLSVVSVLCSSAAVGLTTTAANTDVAQLSVEELNALLRDDWGLPCMAEGFRSLHFDGEKLTNSLKPQHITPQLQQEVFPRCMATHWAFLWDRLGYSSEPQQLPVAATADDDNNNNNNNNNNGKTLHHQRRRLLSDSDPVFSGLEIKRNDSAIILGATGDAAVVRSGESTLTVRDHLEVRKTLMVGGESIVARKRCADVDTSGLNGTVTVPMAPTDGDFIPTGYIKCVTGNHFPTSRVHWVCDEDGGVARPSTDLCFYSMVHCHEDIDGGGWSLVRRVKPGTTWHPATDDLFGTDVYGTFQNNGTVDATFSREYADEITDTTQFLFSSGDCVHWLVAEMKTVLDTFGSPFDADITTASDDPDPHSALWYNRASVSEDPWISLIDHSDAITADTILYGEDEYSGNHYGVLVNNNGANVYIRDPEAS